MAQDRFFIGPLNSGLVDNVRPWLIPDEAFSKMENAYVYRGRVRKRFGSTLMNTAIDSTIAQFNSRLRIFIGTTNGAGNLSTTVTSPNIGQQFTIGTSIYTASSAAAGPQPMLETVATTTATFNSATGAVVFVGAPINSQVYFYPSLPVMGLLSVEDSGIHGNPLIAFDGVFSYLWSGTDWGDIDTTTWSGTDADFFWGTNYRGTVADENLFFVTNFVAADSIKYLDGGFSWNNFSPVINGAGDQIITSKLIVSFKGRLILLNTVETAGSFVNRARWSQVGSALGANAWNEKIAGKGGFLNAPTQEAIVSAQFLRDRLIVFFERSTYELVWMGNEIDPFIWQKINTELGAESTFSIIPFDKVTVGIGLEGIHACNGVNVERIDDKIPNHVFSISNVDGGKERVNGIRDYFTEMLYWAYPEDNSGGVYPNKVLTYNYRTNAWGINDDSITCFGNVESDNSGISDFKHVVAGNQAGFTFIIDSESARNSQSLPIINITAPLSVVTLFVPSHNLQSGDYIMIENALGITEVNGNIYEITRIDADNFSIVEPTVTGVYTGRGTVARVSRIDLLTRNFNFYAEDGQSIHLEEVDFFVDKTNSGTVTVDFFSSTSSLSMITEAEATGSLVGDSTLQTYPYTIVPLENSQERFWHTVFFNAEGENVQLRLFLSDSQMEDPDIALSDFVLNAMVLHTNPTKRLG